MTERSTDGLEFQAISRNGESLMLPPFIHLLSVPGTKSYYGSGLLPAVRS
jgi:hypothetical protein